MFIQIVGTFVLCRSLNNYVISFLVKQMMMGLFIIWIMMLLIALMTTSFDRQTTLSLLKQKDGKRRVLYINQIVLIVLVTISGYLSGSVVHQGNALLSSYKDRHKWESIRSYYIVPTLTNIENQDLFSKRDFLTRQKGLYERLNKQGGIFSDFNEFDKVSQHRGSQGYINVNYLKKWAIYDIHHRRIRVSDYDQRRVILAPEGMSKQTLIQMTKAMYEIHNGYHIIYYQKGTSFFTYNSQIISHHTNSLVNPVIQVLTSHNGSGSDYDCILGYKYNPYKMKGPRSKIMNTLKTYGMDTYVKSIENAYGDMSQDVHQQSMMLIGIFLTMISLIVLIVIMLKTNIYMYMAMMHKRLAIMKCHGYSLKERYLSLIFINSVTIVIIIGLGFFMHMMIYSIMTCFLLSLISYVQIHHHETSVIIKALKGECYD